MSYKDIKTVSYGMSEVIHVDEFIASHLKDNGSGDQIIALQYEVESLQSALGKVCDILVSKNFMSSQDVLNVVGSYVDHHELVLRKEKDNEA